MKKNRVKAATLSAAIILALFAIPQFGHAQGLVRGAQEGAYEGNRVAGPVGGVVGGAVGAGDSGSRLAARLSLPRLLRPLRSFPLLSVIDRLASLWFVR